MVLQKPLSHSSVFDKTANKSKYLVILDKEILSLIKKMGYANMIKHIVNKLTEFPYKKYYIPEKVIYNSFEKLSKYKYKLVETPYKIYSITFLDKFLFENKSLIFEKNNNDYLDYNIMSDYFQEECRIRCKRFDATMSPLDFWSNQSNKDLIVRTAIKKYGKINAYSCRETLYELSNECTSFRPTVMVSLIQLFDATTILDFSAGWGDRLLGAMSQDSKIEYYCGVDPNTCLHPNYDKMMDFFKKDRSKYNMIISPFQTAIIPDREYDMVCTSPPYFTLECYTDECTQSVSSCDNNVDKWLNDFLFFSIKKAWSHLKNNGHLIIIINDMKHIKFVEEMIKFIKDIKGSVFKGVIGYGEKVGELEENKYKSPQPIWIWQKQEKEKEQTMNRLKRFKGHKKK